jgi:hypothetical protein
LGKLRQKTLGLSTLADVLLDGVILQSVLNRFPELFSKTIEKASCVPYNIELSDSVPIRSAPHLFSPSKATISKKIVDNLLQQGVIKPSKSQYASLSFMVPTHGGDFRLVLDYRKVNPKVVFDYYPKPMID